MSSSTDKPAILLISLTYLTLNHNVSTHLLSALQSAAYLIQAEKASTALGILSQPEQYPTLKGILLGDPDLLKPKHAALRRRVVEFARSGGRVVLGCAFSALVRWPGLDKWFEKDWALDWKSGAYTGDTYYLNPYSENRLRGKSLAASYSQKALLLKGVEPEDCVYIQGVESCGDLRQAPVAFTKVGEGFLGYIGDVNSMEETTSVVLAMFDLI
ncbi:MAG: hypothetical protein M1816_002180 [Peltula sp. TS41687]|nr:MAG: hypothetical protein M1816_002180 [Peltula sp. TS41687]